MPPAVQLLLFSAVVPLVAFCVLAVMGRRMGPPLAGYVGTGAAMLGFGATVAALVAWLFRTADEAGGLAVTPYVRAVSWLPVGPGVAQRTGGFLDLALYVDSLTVLLAAVVTLIAAVVHVFSLGYLKEDDRYPRYFAYLQLFVFAMLGLLLSGTLLQLLVFWELVGLCSYLLIGYDHHDPKAQNAAKKAFVVNRVADVGFLVGLGILFAYVGNLTLPDLWLLLGGAGGGGAIHLPDGALMTPAVLSVIGIGLTCGALGKSAQFPLHVWLPDAMAGPTPVSALIHAATMVAAGVYLLARLFPILTPDAKLFICVIGVVTLTVGGLCAVAQRDIKRVLAYSTISQLGYMVLAIGAGSWIGATFHLITHAFFKALLFLCAGSVLHAVRHETRLDRFGGLIVKLPVTAVTFAVGALALSATPFLSGWFSKELILGNVGSLALLAERARASAWWQVLFWAPVVIAYVTPFYMARVWMLTFMGRPRDVALFARAREPGVISFPLVFLTGLTIVAGYSWFPVRMMIHNAADEQTEHLAAAGLVGAAGPYARAWRDAPERATADDLFDVTTERSDPVLTAGENLVVAGAEKAHAAAGWAWLVGLAAGVLAYARGYAFPALVMKFAPVRWVRGWLEEGMFIDALYDQVIKGTTLGLAFAARWCDEQVIDPIVGGLVAVGRAGGRLARRFDEDVIDGAVNGTAEAVIAAGAAVRTPQTGRVRGYAAVVIGSAVIAAAGVIVIALMGRL